MKCQISDRCIGCRACEDICFLDALTFDDNTGHAVIDSATCIGCGACAHECPNDAIDKIEQ